MLHDGIHRVKSISILCLFKNNEEYCVYLFAQLRKLEQQHSKVQFHYLFFENDSTDATPQLLRAFMQDRKGKVFTEKLPNLQYVNKETNYERTNTLATLRNMLLQKIRPHQHTVDAHAGHKHVL